VSVSHRWSPSTRRGPPIELARSGHESKPVRMYCLSERVLPWPRAAAGRTPPIAITRNRTGIDHRHSDAEACCIAGAAVSSQCTRLSQNDAERPRSPDAGDVDTRSSRERTVRSLRTQPARAQPAKARPCAGTSCIALLADARQVRTLRADPAQTASTSRAPRRRARRSSGSRSCGGTPGVRKGHGRSPTGVGTRPGPD
jgi:hypothetical protein